VILLSSIYYQVKCQCGKEKVIFSHVTSVVKCPDCGADMATPSGGHAVIHGTIVKKLG